MFPELVAHRGFPHLFPENTLVGVEAAINAGAKFVEIDIQLTQDEVPVLFHDDNLKRLCNAKGAIHKLEYKQIKKLRAGDFRRFGQQFKDTPVPSLNDFAELIKQYPKVTVFIDVKPVTTNYFPATRIVEKILNNITNIHDQSVIICYNTEILYATYAAGHKRLGYVTDRWPAKNQQHILSTLKAEFIFCRYQGLPKKGPLNSENVKVAIFEIIDPNIALQLGQRGVDLVETFNIADMLAAKTAYQQSS